MKHAYLCFAAFTIALTIAVDHALCAEPKFPLGRDTTYVDGPLDAEGYVDYAAAINQRMSRGITPDENANVWLWQAFGPKPVSESIRKEYFAALGMPVPPADGPYYQDIGDYWKRLDFPNHPGVYQSLMDARDQATQRPWKAEEFPQIAEWVAANERPLGVIRDAVERTKFFDPLICPPATDDEPTSLMGAPLPGMMVWRDAVRALVARAMLRLADGQFDEAWDDLVTAHRLSRRVSHGAALVSGLAALSMEGIIDTADVSFARHANISAARLLECAEELDCLPPMPSIATALDCCERCMALDLVQGLRRYGVKSLHTVIGKASDRDYRSFDSIVMSSDFIPALRKVNGWSDRLVAAAQNVDRKAARREFEKIATDLKSVIPIDGWDRTWFLLGTILGSPETRGRRFGDVVVSLFMPPMTFNYHHSIDRHHQVSTNRRAAFALAAFHAEQGRYPAKLDELAPKYLATVPSDLFADGPLKYRTTDDGYLLYSVGVNGKDDEGRTADDEPVRRFDDLRVRVSRVKRTE